MACPQESGFHSWPTKGSVSSVDLAVKVEDALLRGALSTVPGKSEGLLIAALPQTLLRVKAGGAVTPNLIGTTVPPCRRGRLLW
jgi:hypothetical protein